MGTITIGPISISWRNKPNVQKRPANEAGIVDVRLLLCDPSDLKGIPYPEAAKSAPPRSAYQPPVHVHKCRGCKKTWRHVSKSCPMGRAWVACEQCRV